jgi:hypothetical protein
VVGAVLAGVGLAAAPSVAQAQTISVPCSTSALITAIGTANGQVSARLRLARSCIYDLTGPFVQAATRGPDGLPIITGDITIDGERSTIRRNVMAPFRILEVAAGGVLRAEELTITGGDAGADTGGGILNARGRVLLERTSVTFNTADNGAGISNDSGDLRLVRSVVSNNQVRAGGGGGGGIYSDGFLLLDRSRLGSNTANTNGGGLFNENGGRAALQRSDIMNNTATLGTGGGIHNAAGGIVQGERLRVESNTATDGGGVSNAGRSGAVVFTRSGFRNNSPNNCIPLNTAQGCRN